MSDPADIQRLIGDLVREGTVVAVDHHGGTARVQFADERPKLVIDRRAKRCRSDDQHYRVNGSHCEEDATAGDETVKRPAVPGTASKLPIQEVT